jgi:hypothetical protein
MPSSLNVSFYIEDCFHFYQSWKYKKILSLLFQYYIHLPHKTLVLSVSFLRINKPSRYPLNLIKMKNASLPCITATAGTRFGQDTINLKTNFIKFNFKNLSFVMFNLGLLETHTHMWRVITTVSLLPPSQVAGSVLRPLTNIPHCCTIHIGVFSDPMWSINLSVATTSLG